MKFPTPKRRNREGYRDCFDSSNTHLLHELLGTVESLFRSEPQAKCHCWANSRTGVALLDYHRASETYGVKHRSSLMLLLEHKKRLLLNTRNGRLHATNKRAVIASHTHANI
jgi:hypothetical protein